MQGPTAETRATRLRSRQRFFSVEAAGSQVHLVFRRNHCSKAATVAAWMVIRREDYIMFKWLLGTRALVLVGAAIVAGVGYWGWFQAVEDDSGLRETMAADVARQVALALPLPDGRPQLAVAAVEADHGRVLADKLKAWIGRRNVRAVELRWWEPLVPARVALPTLSVEDACQAAARCGIAYVVSADVEQWVTFPSDQRQLVVNVRMIDSSLQTVVYENRFALNEDSAAIGMRVADRGAAAIAGVAPSPADKSLVPVDIPRGAAEGPAWLLGPVGGFVAWLAVALLLPWSLWRVIERVLHRRSNAAGAWLMVAGVACIVGLGWILWLHTRPDTAAWLLLAAVTLLWVGYLEFVCRCVASVKGV